MTWSGRWKGGGGGGGGGGLKNRGGGGGGGATLNETMISLKAFCE